MMRLKDIGLTQEGAAELLDVRRASISDTLTGKTGRGPVAGALEYLYASWGELTSEQRDAVRYALKKLRSPPTG